MKNLLPLFFSFFSFCFMAQTVIWQDDFESPANWTLNVSTGTNGMDANLWVISDAEGGVAAGGCGVASNGNKTLHIGCQGQWCVGSGATYNAGDGGLGFMDATTNKRAHTANPINTLNSGALNLEFDYIGIGQPGLDFGKVIYSLNGGTSWNVLQSIASATNCPSGQGLWTHVSLPLPVSCSNLSTLKLGFEWTNDNDGAGTDPSLALNNLKITSPAVQNVSANFTTSANVVCEGNCFDLVNTSLGATTYTWSFGNGQTSTQQSPQSLCYTAPGQYTIQLIACMASTCDTTSLVVNVLPYLVGQVFVTATGSYLWPANGVSYNASGVYTDTISNPNACDSILTLNLEILTGGIDEMLFCQNKQVRKITDLNGKEIDKKSTQIVLIYFEDGTVSRIFCSE